MPRKKYCQERGQMTRRSGQNRNEKHFCMATDTAIVGSGTSPMKLGNRSPGSIFFEADTCDSCPRFLQTPLRNDSHLTLALVLWELRSFSGRVCRCGHRATGPKEPPSRGTFVGKRIEIGKNRFEMLSRICMALSRQDWTTSQTCFDEGSGFNGFTPNT